MSKKEIHIGDGDRIKIERPFHWGLVVVISIAVVVVGAISGMALWVVAGRAAAPPPTPSYCGTANTANIINANADSYTIAHTYIYPSTYADSYA